MTKTRTVTRRDAGKVLAAVRKQLAGALFGEGPQIVDGFDWLGGSPCMAIVWEEGPFEWTYLFPYGGIEEEFGFTRKDVSKDIPVGLFCEPITSWAIGIHPA